MEVLQPGGQMLYLDSYQYFQYSKASPNGTEGGTVTNPGVMQFKTEEMEDGQLKLVNYESYGVLPVLPPSNDWHCCEGPANVWEVGPGAMLRCVASEIVLRATDAPAPQYYKYWNEE